MLPDAAQRVLDAVGAVAATSANEPGEPAAASLDEVPQRIREGCGAEVDAGRLPGIASTVLDFTGDGAARACARAPPRRTRRSPASGCRAGGLKGAVGETYYD